MSACYTKRTKRLNINESVFESIRYALKRYGKFTAWDIQAIINNTVRDADDAVTIKQVRARLSGHIGGHFDLERIPNSSYYQRRIRKQAA